MRLYALGAIAEFSFLYDIENIKITIIQPRLDSISTDEMKVEELLKWAEEELKPIAKLAYEGKGEFVRGIIANSVGLKQCVKLELIRIWN